MSNTQKTNETATKQTTFATADSELEIGQPDASDFDRLDDYLYQVTLSEEFTMYDAARAAVEAELIAHSANRRNASYGGAER